MTPFDRKPLRSPVRTPARGRSWLGFGVVLPSLLGGAGPLCAEPLLPPALPVVTAGETAVDSLRLTGPEAGAVIPRDQNPLVPWWQTNPAAANLFNGPRLGTDAVGSLAPERRTALPTAPAAGGQRTDVPPVLRWGPVTAHPSLGYGMTYGTGLVPGPGRTESMLIHTLSPGLGLDLGPDWKVDYAPRLVFYSADGYRDAVNQAVTLEGASRRGAWDMSFGNNYSATDNPLVETGRQTQQTANMTRLGGIRPLTPVLSMDLDVSQALRWTSGFNRTFSWSILDSLDHQLRDDLSVGLVGGLGYDQIEPGGDMSSERLQGRLRGRVGEKLSYNVSGGVEFRQFMGTDAPTKISPVLDGSLDYQVTSTTGLGVYYQRQVSPSYFNDEFIETTAVGGSLSQRLLGHLNLSLTGGYRWTDRNSTANPTQRQNKDDYTFVRVGLSTRFLRRGSISVFYLWSDNASTVQSLSFMSRQIGVNVSYGF